MNFNRYWSAARRWNRLSASFGGRHFATQIFDDLRCLRYCAARGRRALYRSNLLAQIGLILGQIFRELSYLRCADRAGAQDYPKAERYDDDDARTSRQPGFSQLICQRCQNETDQHRECKWDQDLARKIKCTYYRHAGYN